MRHTCHIIWCYVVVLIYGEKQCFSNLTSYQVFFQGIPGNLRKFAVTSSGLLCFLPADFYTYEHAK